MSKEIIEMPEHLKKFNWGAFLWTWIWGIGNNTWIALIALLLLLLSFIPFVFLAYLAFAIFLGIKGNEFAWKNKEWKSEEHFTKVQKLWAGWGLGCFIASIILMFIFGVLVALMLPSVMQGVNEAKARHEITVQQEQRPDTNVEPNPDINRIQQEQRPVINNDFHQQEPPMHDIKADRYKHKPHQPHKPHQKGPKHHKEKHSEQ